MGGLIWLFTDTVQALSEGGCLNRLLLLLLYSICIPGYACGGKGKPNEQSYTSKWCASQGGREGIVYDDKTRPDCVTDTHVFEFECAKKWYEAVGQSLHYGLKSGKKAAVVLILTGHKDTKYWERISAVVKQYQLPIELHQVGAIVPVPAKEIGTYKG